MKALVISGGGSKGAFAGGVAEYLINDCGNNYDILVGSSTGSLLLPHLAIGKVDKIKKNYTTVTQKDIFSISPFRIRKTNKGFETRINHYNTFLTFLKGCPTFGENETLRTLIKNSVSCKIIGISLGSFKALLILRIVLSIIFGSLCPTGKWHGNIFL